MVSVEVIRISYYPPSKGYAVLLEELSGNRQLPIIVGSTEAQAIALALENIEMPRPLTHDLLTNILDHLDAEVVKVVISHLTNGTFYAYLVLNTAGRGEIKIDSRPSDAIAVGLRAMAPIYVSNAVMDSSSIENLVTEEGEAPEAAPLKKHFSRDETLENLQAALQQAVEEEEYEVAAKIRDRITHLKKQQSSH